MSMFTEFTYVLHPKGGGIRRVLFVWVGRWPEDADEAFEEVMGSKPGEIQGLELEEKDIELKGEVVS